MLALKILNERLADLEHIQKMYQSTQVQNDILETKEAIAELEDMMFNDYEAQLKAKDEEIVKLKAIAENWRNNFLSF